MGKGVSELLSVVIIIGIIVIIAGLVGPWAMNFSRRQVNSIPADSQIICQNTAYDFDTSYGSSGVNWDLPSREMKAKIINTGTINLHSFSFQVYIQGAGYRFFKTKENITPDNPLKPGQSILLDADINESLSGTVTEVRILNGVCRSVSAAQEY
jgi:FlaG/FlaF family flagellin (archaellin)